MGGRRGRGPLRRLTARRHNSCPERNVDARSTATHSTLLSRLNNSSPRAPLCVNILSAESELANAPKLCAHYM